MTTEQIETNGSYHEPTVAEKMFDRRIKEESERACDAWGMEDGHGYSVKDTYKAGFVQGAFHALSHQWISVEEALPETGADGCSGYVLATRGNFIPKIAQYTDNSHTRKYTYKGDDGKRHENHWFDTCCRPLLRDITHWMPIPELPQDNNQTN